MTRTKVRDNLKARFCRLTSEATPQWWRRVCLRLSVIIVFIYLLVVRARGILGLCLILQTLYAHWCRDENVHQQSAFVCVCPQNWNEVVSKANEHMTRSVVSVKVTSDISASCNASNDMGTEVKAFSIKASKSRSPACTGKSVWVQWKCGAEREAHSGLEIVTNHDLFNLPK